MNSPEPAGWRQLAEQYARRRYGILFLTLLLTLSAAPVAAQYGFRGGPIELLLLLNLSAAALGAETVRHRRGLLALLVTAVGLRLLGRWLQFDPASTIAAFLWVVLMVGAAAGALRFALRGRKVDSEHLSAALSAYLLVGHVFGIVYYQVELLRPGSFAVGQAAASAQFDLQTGVYFSFVTLATLGYGDIVPVTPLARGFAVSEAVLGQLYLAVLVARLISAYSPRSR